MKTSRTELLNLSHSGNSSKPLLYDGFVNKNIMMETNELRTGNYIGRDGNILIVEKINSNGNVGFGIFKKSQGQQVNSGNKYFIKLTEQWLRDFKAESSFTSDPQETQASKKFLIQGIVIHMPNEDLEDFIFEDDDDFIDIKYVHQIQNLYFDKKGSKLQISSEDII